MTKKELVNVVAETTNRKIATVETIANAMFDAMNCELAKDGEVVIRNFGTFCVKLRSGRPGRNFHTGETVNIPAKRKVVFKSSLKLD